MLDILKNFNEAEKGNKPAAAAQVGSMKSILESIQAIGECGDMPMEMPTQMPQQGQPVTVSITASGKENVDELMAILRGAGIEQHVDMPMAHDAHVDTDSHNVAGPEMDMDTMRAIMAAGEKDDEPEMDMEKEEWDNAPDEEYGSEDDVLTVGDDLHRPKDPKAVRAKDPAMEALANSLKSDLRKALEEKMSKKKDVKAAEGEQHGNSSMYDKCWDGYERVPGKTRGEKGSCRKK